ELGVGNWARYMRDDVAGSGSPCVALAVELLYHEWQKRRLPGERRREHVPRVEGTQAGEDLHQSFVKLKRRKRGIVEPSREYCEALDRIGRIHRHLQWEVDVDLFDQDSSLIDQSLLLVARQHSSPDVFAERF